MRRTLSAVPALIVGLLAAFLLVFNTLFADGPGGVLHPEYLLAYGLIVVVYGLAAFAVARWGGWDWWTAAWLATPAALVVLAYQDPGLLLRAWVALSVALGTVGGILLARRLGAAPAAGETA